MAGLTRDEMTKIIERGESFFFKGKDNGLRIISRLQDIPDEAELALASNDPEKVKQASDLIDAQIKALQDAKASLNQAPAKVEAKAIPAAVEAKSPEVKPAPKPEAK